MEMVTVELIGKKRKGEFYSFYHLSPIVHKKVKKFIPRVPKNKFVELGIENPKDNRICVAKTIEQCLMSIGHIGLEGTIFRVYELKVPINDIVNPGENYVPDVILTNEKWIIRKTKGKIIGAIIVLNETGKHITYNVKTEQLEEVKIPKYHWRWITGQTTDNGLAKFLGDLKSILNVSKKINSRYDLTNNIRQYLVDNKILNKTSAKKYNITIIIENNKIVDYKINRRVNNLFGKKSKFVFPLDIFFGPHTYLKGDESDENNKSTVNIKSATRSRRRISFN